MIYITGDRHADLDDIIEFCKKKKTSTNDIIVILGDSGINYFLNDYNHILKEKLSKINITYFCVHGSHEERCENLENYKIKQFHNGKVFYEEEFPNILFAKDAEVYTFNKHKVLVVGGSYSIDKIFRLNRGFVWFKDEQPSQKTKDKVMKSINKRNDIDTVFSHTCPYEFAPKEIFTDSIYYDKLDLSTEYFFDEVFKKINCKLWCCGRFHMNMQVGKVKFFYKNI